MMSNAANAESAMCHQERWQVSGKAAKAYERYLVPTLFTPWAHDLIARTALQSGERVLDPTFKGTM